MKLSFSQSLSLLDDDRILDGTELFLDISHTIENNEALTAGRSFFS
jgi:hypothetical protein